MLIRVFIGYDRRQPVAYHVAAQSILNYCTQPVSITPLNIDTLPITREGLTPFTFTRFLVPWLCGFQGKALFMDSDFLCRADISPLFERLENNDLCFVPHEGARRFERASMMLFDCEKFRYMTPDFVQTAKNLLTCEFSRSPGYLEKSWNHLVGYDTPNPSAKLVHFTQGLPCYPQTANDEFAGEWMACATQCNSTSSWEELMGQSVHAPHVHQRAKEAANV